MIKTLKDLLKERNRQGEDVMIFNEDFDRSLWLVLASDRYNREDIAKLIYNIPNELLQSIVIQLNEYNDSSREIDDSYKVMSKLDICANGDNCFYIIEMNRYEINIRVNCWFSDFDEVYELTLISLSKNNLDDVNSRYIGSYTYDNYFLLPNDSRNVDRQYNLISNVLFGLKFSKIDIGRYSKLISLRKMPNDIIMSDLESRKSVKKLVRKRKNK